MYIIIFSIFQKILYIPSKNLVFKKIFKKSFNIKIISVEATNIEHIIKYETIYMSPARPITMVGQSKKANFPFTGCLEKHLIYQGHIFKTEFHIINELIYHYPKYSLQAIILL